jgi:hypothetical protein
MKGLTYWSALDRANYFASGGDDVNDDDQITDTEQIQSGMFFDGGDGFNQIFASNAGNSTIVGGDDFDRIYVAGGTGNFVDAGTGSDSNDDIIDYGETTLYSCDGLGFYSLAADQTNLVSTLQDIDLEEDAIIILLDQSEIDLQPDRDDIIYGIDATGEYNTLSYTHTNGFVEVVAHIPISIGTAEDIQNNLVIDFWPASIENPDSDLASASQASHGQTSRSRNGPAQLLDRTANAPLKAGLHQR